MANTKALMALGRVVSPGEGDARCRREPRGSKDGVEETCRFKQERLCADTQRGPCRDQANADRARERECLASTSVSSPWACKIHRTAGLLRAAQQIPLGPDVVVHAEQRKRGHRLGGYGSLAGRRPCGRRSGVPWPRHSGWVDWQEGAKPRDDNDHAYSDMIIVIAGLVYCSQSRTLGPRMGICGFHIAVGRLCRIRGNLTKGLLDRSLQPGDSVHARAVPVLRRCEQDGG